MKNENNNKGETLAATEGKNVNPFAKKSLNTNDLEIFVTFDSKSKAYDLPMFIPNKEILMRDIINQMNDSRNQMQPKVLNAEDYSIFKIGSYSFAEGKITTQPLEHIANYHDLRAMSNWQFPKYETAPVQVQSPPTALFPT